MQNGLAAAGKVLAVKGVIVQIIMTLLVTLTVAVVHSEYVITVLFGCLSFLVPHSIFAFWVFRHAGATKNELVAQSFSQGMKIKLFLTVLFFIIAFSQLNAHPLPLLGAYVIIMVSQWLAMFKIKH
jgi:ATP synthase protein I